MKYALISVACVLAGSAFAKTDAPYGGQQTRDIASLSAQDIDDLQAGRGWGFAKAAELNGYPGPTHVLELADELQLTDAQRADIEAIFAAMQAEAQRLGAAFVEAEAALDQAFEAGTIEARQLPLLTANAAALEADLRAVHLAAHLQVKPILTRHQVVTYNRLRGYGDGVNDHGGHEKGGH